LKEKRVKVADVDMFDAVECCLFDRNCPMNNLIVDNLIVVAVVVDEIDIEIVVDVVVVAIAH
jgi:hypothetical protein